MNEEYTAESRKLWRWIERGIERSMTRFVERNGPASETRFVELLGRREAEIFARMTRDAQAKLKREVDGSKYWETCQKLFARGITTSNADLLVQRLRRLQVNNN